MARRCRKIEPLGPLVQTILPLTYVMCHMSCITCHMSHVTCHMSPALPCLLSYLCLDWVYIEVSKSKDYEATAEEDILEEVHLRTKTQKYSLTRRLQSTPFWVPQEGKNRQADSVKRRKHSYFSYYHCLVLQQTIFFYNIMLISRPTCICKIKKENIKQKMIFVSSPPPLHPLHNQYISSNNKNYFCFY